VKTKAITTGEININHNYEMSCATITTTERQQKFMKSNHSSRKNMNTNNKFGRPCRLTAPLLLTYTLLLLTYTLLLLDFPITEANSIQTEGDSPGEFWSK